MRTGELIKLMPTQYRRISETNPLYRGHFVPLLGYWTEDEGFVKKQELEYESEVLSCPIIAVVETKIGNQDLSLRVTGKQAQYNQTTQTVSGTHTLERKTYVDAGTTITTTLEIPRYTRPFATFLVTGLGQNIWSISNVTTSVTSEVGKVSFYALASNGSKLIYWMGIHFLAQELKEILRPWIAPSKCSRCSGTGIEPGTTTTDCVQCQGYKYSGYSAVKYIQRRIGNDVGLAREILDWDNLSEADHTTINTFINKCWTQKWWVTPTVNEIKRLFAHFYDVTTEEIRITERYSSQEPIWYIYLPRRGSLSSPFGTRTFGEDDFDLVKFIAESVTPAGVSVFMGFYRDFFMGDMDDIDNDTAYLDAITGRSSSEHEFELYGMPRNDFYNGWTLATDDFEREPSSFPDWTVVGSVDVIDVNDMNRHMAQFTDNSSISRNLTGDSGFFELWTHPLSTEMRYGLKNGNGDWMFYIEYDANGFYDSDGLLLTMATPDNDYHVYAAFNNSGDTYDVKIREPGGKDQYLETGKLYLNSATGVSSMIIESIGTGYGYVDAYGDSEDSGYTLNDNWQRLHPYGTGLDNSQLWGSINVVDEYLKRDRFIDIDDLP